MLMRGNSRQSSSPARLVLLSKSVIAVAILCCAASTLPAALAASPEQTEKDPQSVVQQKNYTVHPGDVIGVSVWKEENMDLDIIVRPDGAFSFPLIGDIQAEGKSIEEIRKTIGMLLHDYIPDPEVTVILKQASGNVAYVIGKVNRPGPVPLIHEMDVMQALSIAGGMSTFADQDHIGILRRNESGEAVRIGFNYSSVAKGKHLEQNVILRKGDVVVVP